MGTCRLTYNEGVDEELDPRYGIGISLSPRYPTIYLSQWEVQLTRRDNPYSVPPPGKNRKFRQDPWQTPMAFPKLLMLLHTLQSSLGTFP